MLSKEATWLNPPLIALHHPEQAQGDSREEQLLSTEINFSRTEELDQVHFPWKQIKKTHSLLQQ